MRTKLTKKKEKEVQRAAEKVAKTLWEDVKRDARASGVSAKEFAALVADAIGIYVDLVSSPRRGSRRTRRRPSARPRRGGRGSSSP